MPAPFKLKAATEAKLKRHRLRFHIADHDTLLIKNVPADHDRFTKPRTNLLIKRLGERMPCVMCVDEDLEYTGTDEALSRSFSAGTKQQGWRVLTLGGLLKNDLASALEYALSLLGFDHGSAAVKLPVNQDPTGLLATFAAKPPNANVIPTFHRDEEVERVAACTLCWEACMPLILGESGAGKSNLIGGVAQRLANSKRPHEVLIVNLGAVMAGTLLEGEREALLASLLQDARQFGGVVVLEQLEWAVIGVPRGLLLLRQALDHNARLIATSLPEHVKWYCAYPLETRLDIVTLRELCPGDTCRVLETHAATIAAHHGVRITDKVIRAVSDRASALGGCLPGKAIRLLDSAAGRASLTGSSEVTVLDVYLTASRIINDAR